ncbi:MAG: 4Fe-4S binding protein [Eubacteriales bacterium]
MIRKIIKIDENKCNGCGICVNACHEGALQMIDGKAKLISESYCDGLGDCLPECPTGAITIEEREADIYDEEIVKKNMSEKCLSDGITNTFSCPGIKPQTIEKNKAMETSKSTQLESSESQLRQWPCQIKLLPISATYYNDAHILVAADCTAYAYANFHTDFMKNKVTVIGCPKLDSIDYSEKLTAILKNNTIKSLALVRMDVPCCGGLENAVKKSLQNCGKLIPWSITTIRTDGTILED